MTGFAWQKSSFSGSGGNGECLELSAPDARVVALRESDDPDTVLIAGSARLAALLVAARQGRLG